MKCAPVADKPGWWKLDLNESEACVLAVTFQRMAHYYKLHDEDLPPSLQAHRRNSMAEPKDVEDLREEQHLLEEERKVWRSERFAQVEKWLASYAASGITNPWSFEMEREEVENLLMILNDRRLTLAAEYELDEALMETDLETITDLSLQQVLGEIHLLALFLGQCLACLAADNPDTQPPTTYEAN